MKPAKIEFTRPLPRSRRTPAAAPTRFGASFASLLTRSVRPRSSLRLLQLLVLVDVVLQVVRVLRQLLDEVHALAHERRHDQPGQADRDEQDGEVDDRDRQAAAHAAGEDVDRARQRDREERREDDPGDRHPEQADQQQDADDREDDQDDAQHRARRREHPARRRAPRGARSRRLAGAVAEACGRGRAGGRPSRGLRRRARRSLPSTRGSPAGCQGCPSYSISREQRARYWIRCREPRNSERTRSPAASPIRCIRRRVGEQRGHRGAVLGEVVGIVEQHAALAVDDLVLDAADAAGDDGAVLPHRLGDGQAEALGEALLHDDRRVTLDGVDDRRVLAAVLHRQAREVHAPADLGRRAPGARRGPARARSRPPGRRARPRATGRRARAARPRRAGRRARRSPCITPTGSFSGSQRETWTTSRSSSVRRSSSSISHLPGDVVGAPVVVQVGRGRDRRARRGCPAVARIETTTSSAIAWFFGPKTSIDGGMIVRSRSCSSGGAYSRRVKMNACTSPR